MSQTVRKAPSTAFKPGWKGGPGRPPGMRNRLTEIALQALGEHFAVHGVAAIDRVYREEPATYLKIVASLLPRQVSIEKLSPFEHLTDEELTLLEETLRAGRAQQVTEIDGKADAVKADKLENK